MSGAIALAGMATLRSGAGLVRLAVPDVCLDVVAAFEPSYMTAALPSDGEGRIGLEAAARLKVLAASADCVACGPGLGQSAALSDLVVDLYSSLKKSLVLDADALNALASRPEVLAQPGGPRVLTPHPGEFRRLVGDAEGRLSPDELARQADGLAARCGIVIVLKGHRTLVTDGQRHARNDTGNPGMATGGSGDVLTGIITALICQKLPPAEAARLGVHIHGLAGDLAAESLGQISLIASDLVRFLPAAFQRLTAE